MIIPKLLEGKALRFNLEKCFYVDMGVTKYEARYRFDWSNVEKIIHETKPDIVFNNQVELSSAFRALLDVRRHIVGGANRTLISVETPLRLCCIGTCRRLSAG